MSKCHKEAMIIERAISGKYNYVSFSGGKDSTAMLLKLQDMNKKIDKIFFADTGFEFPELYEFLNKFDVTILKPKTYTFKQLKDKNNLILNQFKSKNMLMKKPIYRSSWNDDSVISLWEYWFYGVSTSGKSKGKQRGYPLRLYSCYYTRESKIKPLQSAMVDAKNIYVGIAFDEVKRYSKDDFIKNPLVDMKWTEQDCVNYLNDKNMLNPLYKNFNRLGCYHCQKQNIGSLFILWKLYPDLWNKTIFWDQESIKISGHGMKSKPLIEYQKEFENGFIPKKLPKYDCVGCDGVASAFNIRQEKLVNYIKNNINMEVLHD